MSIARVLRRHAFDDESLTVRPPLALCSQRKRAATTATLEHGELLRKERALAEREEEIKGWKDRRIEEGLKEIKVSARGGGLPFI